MVLSQIVVYVYMLLHYLLLLDFQPHLGTVSRAMWRARGELSWMIFLSCLSTMGMCYSMIVIFDIGEIPALTTTNKAFSYFYMTAAIYLAHLNHPEGGSSDSL